MAWQLVLQLVLICCNAVFACAEIAVISMNDAKLDRLAADGDKRAQRLRALTNEPARFLATIQVAITLSGFIGSAFAADNFSEPLVQAAVRAGIPISAGALKSIAVILITLILSYFTLVFGELVPKRVAMKKAEPLALGMSGLISVISKLFAPIVGLLNLSTNGVLRLLGIDPKGEEENVTEEEIILMSDAGAEKGTIDEADSRIIKNIFAFDDKKVGQICTHRTQVTMLFAEDSDEEWQTVIHNENHGKIPICGERVDDIIGVLDVRAYYRLSDKSRENVMQYAVRAPYYVHEFMKADVLFDAMKRHDAEHFAIVIDEYGGMSGIITVTDLVEQLVGDFSEEQGASRAEIEKTGENEWRVSGMMPLYEVAQELRVELPTDQFETLGGYLLSYVDFVPREAATLTVTTEALEATQVRVQAHRIESCLLRVRRRT